LAKLTPQEYAEKWGRRLKGSTEDIRKGVERVTVAPSSLAIAQKEKMKQKLLASIEDGTWERMLAGYSLEDWKRDMKNTGISRISGGVDKANGKMVKFGNWLMPRIAEEQAKLENMPSTTLEDNVNRMTTFVRGMASKKYKKGE